MKLIRKTHENSLYPNEINIDHAQFSVILLHTLLSEDNSLGVLNDELISFLDWLFEILAEYEYMDKLGKINITIDHIKQLQSLCRNESNKVSK
ncbi:unnamed protein product, partial [Rotaria sp. Silwood2]